MHHEVVAHSCHGVIVDAVGHVHGCVGRGFNVGIGSKHVEIVLGRRSRVERCSCGVTGSTCQGGGETDCWTK